MYRSEDGLLNISVVQEGHCPILYPADISLIYATEDNALLMSMTDSLYALAEKQILLVIPQGKRLGQLNAMANIKNIRNWKFLDKVAITYSKPSQFNGNRLVQLSDFGFIFYKSNKTPSIASTKWFRDEYSNAGNHWDLSPNSTYDRLSHTTFRSFASELVLILHELVKPLQSGRVNWAIDGADSNMFFFVKKSKIQFHVTVTAADQAQSLMTSYENT